jgi:hypothetical protein
MSVTLLFDIRSVYIGPRDGIELCMESRAYQADMHVD